MASAEFLSAPHFETAALTPRKEHVGKIHARHDTNALTGGHSLPQLLRKGLTQLFLLKDGDAEDPWCAHIQPDNCCTFNHHRSPSCSSPPSVALALKCNISISGNFFCIFGESGVGEVRRDSLDSSIHHRESFTSCEFLTFLPWVALYLHFYPATSLAASSRSVRASVTPVVARSYAGSSDQRYFPSSILAHLARAHLGLFPPAIDYFFNDLDYFVLTCALQRVPVEPARQGGGRPRERHLALQQGRLHPPRAPLLPHRGLLQGVPRLPRQLQGIYAKLFWRAFLVVDD